MPLKAGNEQFIGTIDGVCGHLDKQMNVYRKASPLDGERVKTDAAFQNLMKSSQHLKDASPIAAALYNQIPPHQKRLRLYRKLTGQVLEALKKGTAETEIKQRLQKKYIDPLLKGIPKRQRSRKVPENERKVPLTGTYLGRKKGYPGLKWWDVPTRDK